MAARLPLSLHGLRLSVQLPDGSRATACAVTDRGMCLLTAEPRLRRGDRVALELAAPHSALVVVAEGNVVAALTIRRRAAAYVRFEALRLRKRETILPT